MFAFLHRIVRGLFIRCFPFEAFEEARHEVVNRRGHAQTQADASTRFLPESKLYNGGQASNIKIGVGCRVRGELLVFDYAHSLTLGDHVFVGEGSRIWSGRKIDIGSNVLISHNCNIIGSNSHERDPELRASSFINMIKDGHPKEKGEIEVDDITIEDHVWINFNVTILKGVRIGRGAIIASGSLVLDDVPPNTLVAGRPATVIKALS